MKYFRNIVCLSGISSDGSICCEAREYQCGGPALFTENFIEGNPITLDGQHANNWFYHEQEC